jgi:hypothetical protein
MIFRINLIGSYINYWSSEAAKIVSPFLIHILMIDSVLQWPFASGILPTFAEYAIFEQYVFVITIMEISEHPTISPSARLNKITR